MTPSDPTQRLEEIRDVVSRITPSTHAGLACPGVHREVHIFHESDSLEVVDLIFYAHAKEYVEFLISLIDSQQAALRQAEEALETIVSQPGYEADQDPSVQPEWARAIAKSQRNIAQEALQSLRSLSPNQPSE